MTQPRLAKRDDIKHGGCPLRVEWKYKTENNENRRKLTMVGSGGRRKGRAQIKH